MLKAIKSRVITDLTAIPFLTMWSLLICLLLEKIPDEKVNTFLANTFSEGIGTRTIFVLLILTMMVTGLSWIFRPKYGSFAYSCLLAPVNAARSTCITTIAFSLGLIIATIITNGLSKAEEMLPTLGLFCLSWFLLHCTETLASEASCNREVQYRKICIALGIGLVSGSLFILYTFYKQIESGSIT
jgi:hypothetical protein